MALSFEEVNILGNIINDTFGKASTTYTQYTPHDSNTSVATKSSLDGNILTIVSLEIINLIDYHYQQKEIEKAENELDQHIKKYVSNLKKEFKKKENAGRTLKCKQVKNSENTGVELINYSAYSAKRSAYVRRTVQFEIE